jgi:tetratricopeptide (TPR) repeat protein
MTNELVANEGKKIAITIYKKVVDLITAGKYAEAIKELTDLDGKILFSHEGLLNAFGISLRAVGRPEPAIAMYQHALKLNSKHGGTWSNLGNALKDADYPSASLAAHLHALNLSDKLDSRLWHNYGISLSIAGKHRLAIDAFEKAIQLSPERMALRWDLARSQLASKDYRNGFLNYQYRWALDDAPPRRVFGKEWDGRALSDDPLFVYVEQGFGDFIQCARYLPLLKEKAPKIVVEVKPELRDLMESSFPDITFIPYSEQIINVNDGYTTSLLDAPRFFIDHPIPSINGYLNSKKRNPELDRMVQEKLNPYQGLKVGIIWSGSVTFKRNKYRSIPVDWFAKNLALPDVRLYSLQVGPKSADLNKIKLPTISSELLPYIQDFSDTVAILKNLDLVIMSCSSVAHLCGALNVPCWILLDSSPHWLWGSEGSTSDWYQSVKLYRQNSPGDWRAVFDEVTSDLLQLSIKDKND